MWNTIRKWFKGKKTVLFNTLGIVIGVIEVSPLTDFLSNDQMITYVLAMAVGNILLRVFATNTEVWKPE